LWFELPFSGAVHEQVEVALGGYAVYDPPARLARKYLSHDEPLLRGDLDLSFIISRFHQPKAVEVYP
jgi:hypothetical protein